MSNTVFIGVDPAFRQGGFVAAILDTSDKSVVFKKFADVLDWHDWLQSGEAPEQAYVCVENSNLQNLNFDMSGNRNVLSRKGRNVGANQAVSELAYKAALIRYPETTTAISPKQKGAKVQDARRFAAIVASDGIRLPKGKISQDARDAYMLALHAKSQSKFTLWNR